MSQAISAALATNPTVEAAAQQLAQTQARFGQARAQKHFQITFDSAVSGSNASVIQPPPSGETFGTLQNTLTVPLSLGRRPRFAIAQAERQLAAGQLQYQSAQFALSAQVAAAFYDVLRKQALRLGTEEQLTLAQRELSDAQKRYQAGDVAQLDLLQAQVPVANAEASLAQAENADAVAQETLNDLLGRPLDASLALIDVTGAPPALPYSLEQARVLALARSLDVREADATVLAADAGLGYARSYREPSFSLQAIDIRSGDQTSFSREDTVQAQVSVPLSDGGLGQAQSREAEAALAQAKAQAESARRAALVAVSAAYLNAESSRAQVTAAQAARDIAQITYDKTIRGYQSGLFPFINVISAQNDLAQARTAYVQALYDAASAANGFQAIINGSAITNAAPSDKAAALSNPAPVTQSGGGSASAGSTGTSPAGAGTPGTTPSGSSTTTPGATGKATQ